MNAPTVRGLDDLRPDTPYRLPSVIDLLPLHRSTVYRHVNTGLIRATRLGGVWVVMGAEVRRVCGAEPAPPQPTETAKQRGKRAADDVARLNKAKT